MTVRVFSMLVASTLPWLGATTPICPQAQSVCDEIYSTAASHLAYAPSSSKALFNSPELTSLYVNTTTSYWDAANDGDLPACVFFPASAEEVSAAIVALGKQPNVPFALKSGGHNWNRGFSSTDGGVLISFRPNLQSTQLAPDGETAKVGPGSRWLEVMQVLDKSNKCVVGGRVGDVGVGGYLLQGGLSYLSAQYGFACDSVIEYELVIANGTILIANNETNPDIFWALHGGGNAFGIVTMYTLHTYDIGDVWGGEITYDPSQLSNLNAALTDFIANNQDPRAALDLNYLLLTGNQPRAIEVSFFYDGPTPSNAFAAFMSIPNLNDTTQTQRYPQLLDVPGTSALGLRSSNAVNSLPNIPSSNMTSFLEWHWNQATEGPFLPSLQDCDIEVFTMALQPIPVGLQQASMSHGPGALALDPAHGDKMWIEYDIGWVKAACDNQGPQNLMRLVDQALAYQKETYAGIEPTHYVSGDLSFVPYNPLFMNDAQFAQDVLGSYGKSAYHKLKDLHHRLDPAGLLTSQQRGFFFGSEA